jgi:hypothetical protein
MLKSEKERRKIAEAELKSLKSQMAAKAESTVPVLPQWYYYHL